MVISCPVCGGTGQLEEESCGTCSGDGEIDLTDANFGKMDMRPAELTVVMGTIWDSLITKLDALQADMDIIKPQIQAIYDDLNP